MSEQGAPRRPGMVLLDKPAGVSSFAAIAGLRPVLGRKLGHAGTLDPFATGLLLVACARATRLLAYLAASRKTYRALVQFGATSTSDDVTGELTASGRRTDEAALAAALAGFRGVVDQVPPAASAIHVDGERAYRRHRRGEDVAMPTRRVELHRLELRTFDDDAQTAELEIECGTGTYIRALARDLGAVLGCGAYCSELRRTAIGAWPIVRAATPEAVRAAPYEPPHWVEPLDVLPDLPARLLDDDERRSLCSGRQIPALGQAGLVRCVADQRLVAIARAVGDALQPELVLGEAA